MIVAARLLFAPTVAVERMDGFQVLRLADRYYESFGVVVARRPRHFAKQGTPTKPSARGHMGSASLQHFLPSRTRSRGTCSTFTRYAAGVPAPAVRGAAHAPWDGAAGEGAHPSLLLTPAWR